MIPVPQQWVTLHRVGTDKAGPLDSVRTGADGSFAFTYRRTGAPDAIYFASSSYGGVAYFTKPLHAGSTTGDDAEIAVFDTTSSDVPISLRGHHVVIGAPVAGNLRRVTDVIELSNDSARTRVARDESANGAVWSFTLPSGAREAALTDGDIPATAVKFAGPRLLVYAPLAPGMKQIVVSYLMPSESFPMLVATPRKTGIFEVLLEEPSASAHGAKLREVSSVTVQGRHFRRYVGADVPAGETATVTVPDIGHSVNPWFVAGLTFVIGGAMTFALARAVRRR